MPLIPGQGPISPEMEGNGQAFGGLSGPLAQGGGGSGSNVFSKLMQGLAGMAGGAQGGGGGMGQGQGMGMPGMDMGGMGGGMGMGGGQVHPEYQKGMQHGIQALLKLFHHLHNMSGQTGQSNGIDNAGINIDAVD